MINEIISKQVNLFFKDFSDSEKLILSDFLLKFGCYLVRNDDYVLFRCLQGYIKLKDKKLISYEKSFIKIEKDIDNIQNKSQNICDDSFINQDIIKVQLKRGKISWHDWEFIQYRIPQMNLIAGYLLKRNIDLSEYYQFYYKQGRQNFIDSLDNEIIEGIKLINSSKIEDYNCHDNFNMYFSQFNKTYPLLSKLYYIDDDFKDMINNGDPIKNFLLENLRLSKNQMKIFGMLNLNMLHDIDQKTIIKYESNYKLFIREIIETVSKINQNFQIKDTENLKYFILLYNKIGNNEEFLLLAKNNFKDFYFKHKEIFDVGFLEIQNVMIEDLYYNGYYFGELKDFREKILSIPINKKLALMDRWIEKKQEAHNKINVKFPKMSMTGWESLYEKKKSEDNKIMLSDNFYIDCLTTSYELQEEGIKMDNCVGSFSFSCFTGTSKILSLRKEGVSYITIEIDVVKFVDWIKSKEESDTIYSKKLPKFVKQFFGIKNKIIEDVKYYNLFWDFLSIIKKNHIAVVKTDLLLKTINDNKDKKIDYNLRSHYCVFNFNEQKANDFAHTIYEELFSLSKILDKPLNLETTPKI